MRHLNELLGRLSLLQKANNCKWKPQRTICPAPSCVTNANRVSFSLSPTAIFTSLNQPAFLLPDFHGFVEVATNSACPCQGMFSAQRMFPAVLHARSKF